MKHAYHATPTAERDELLAAGIVADLEGEPLYLYDSEELALRRARVLLDSWIETPEGTADIWRVDMSGIEAELHPHVNDGENVTADVERIAPDRLTLATTI
jgi:hypothetical protein